MRLHFVVSIYIKVRNHSRVSSCHPWDTWESALLPDSRKDSWHNLYTPWTCTHWALQVTALEFSSVRMPRTFWTVRKLSACRERHCKMCLTGSLHAHAFPKMLRIPALNHSNLCGGFFSSVPPSVCACVSWFDVGNVRGTTVWIPRLKNFAAIFLVLNQNRDFFWTKNPIRCDFL